MRDALNGPFALNKKFLEKIIVIFFIYLLLPFTVQNFKKILRANPELRMCHFWGQNDQFTPKKEFFRKLVNKPCFFHSRQSKFQDSKADINLNWQINNKFFDKSMFSWNFTTFRVTIQPTLGYIWGGKFYNELNFLINSTPWQIIKITISH